MKSNLQELLKTTTYFAVVYYYYFFGYKKSTVINFSDTCTKKCKVLNWNVFIWRYFTWDAHKFPNSKGMIDQVAAKGRKMVTIVDPHIKKDTNYKVYEEAHDAGHFIKDKNGNAYDGWCWPGTFYPLVSLGKMID